MDKKYIIGLSLVIILVMGIVIFNQPTQETIISGSGETQYIKELERAFTPTDYQIVGDTVFIDDQHAYISATPHTGLGWITFNVTSKTYTGDVDLVLGFDTNYIKPTKARANPRQVNLSKSYVCEEEFNYTQDPNYFWCYTETETNNSQIETNILFEHAFDSGNLAQKTAYWEEEVTQWTDISGAFDSRNLNLFNLTKWYFKKDIPFVVGQERVFQIYLQPQTIDIGSHKYWMGIKPSEETIEQSIENNHFYILDPWTPSLNNELVAYYKFDESSGGVVDSTGNLSNGTNSGATRGVTGIINDAFDFEQSEVDVVDTLDGGTGGEALDFLSDFSISVWIKPESFTNANGYIIGKRHAGGYQYNFRTSGTGSTSNLNLLNTGGSITSSGLELTLGTFQHIVATYDADGNTILYRNNVAIKTDASKSITHQATDTRIGNAEFASSEFDGVIDEVAFYSKILSPTDISNLWNGGAGISLPSEPIVNIIFPVNGTTYSVPVTDLNYTVDLAQACWSSTDLGVTNSTPVVAGVNFTLSSNPMWNNWTVFCNNSAGDVGSDLTQFFVNKSVGTTLITPANGFLTNQSSILFTYNSTVLNTNLTNTTFWVWFDNGTLLQTNFTSLSGTSEVTTSINISNFIDSEYIWTAETCGLDVPCSIATNRTFESHTVNPMIVINAPSGFVNYLKIGGNLTLNWTVSESGENITDHIINCSYTYNDSVTNINASICTGVNSTTFEYVLGKDSITFNVTDKFNLTNSTNSTWDFKVLEINQTYSNQTTEGGIENFLANVRLGSGFTIAQAVVLDYNGTRSSGQSFIVGDLTTLRKIDFIIPGVEADSNVSFHWELLLSDATAINLSTQNQTVIALGIDNCSSFTNEILNFTVVDEETQVILPNATVEIAVNIFDQKRQSVILEQSDLYERVNPVRICLNNVIPTGLTYSLDSITRYEDVDKANEYYNIVNHSLQNGTASQRIILFDLNLSESTEFQLTFTGADFLPVENALVSVNRQYISENVFKTVELPKTDANGQAVLHLVRNDVIYNIRIVKGGAVLGNFENIVAFCDDFTIGDCNINLNAFDSVEAIFNYNAELGIIFTQPEFNATIGQVSFDFVTSDGVARSVRLEVTRNDIFGNRSICNSTLLSSGGTLACNVPTNLEDSILRTEIYVNEELAVVNQVKLDPTNFGVGGYLVLLVMAMSFVFMFVSSGKTGVLISVAVTLSGAIGLGMMTGDIIGIGASGLWLIIIVAIGIYKLNRDRSS